MPELLTIACQFCDAVSDIQPLGNGYINDTYRVVGSPKSFVLQRINRRVFPHPEHIMANLTQLNRHILQLKNSEITLQIPQLLLTQSGANFIVDAVGDYWRALDFIDNTKSLEAIANIDQAREVGVALGQFHRLTENLATETLCDTLPGFHIAPKYFQHYQQVKEETNIPNNTEYADFIQQNQAIINDLETAKALGLLKIRTIHGDPKLNNFLFNKTNGKIVSLVDLDTVKPGLIHYDIGDCLRSCCHVEGTDEFSLDCCKAVLAGYLDEMGATFSQADYQLLYPAIRLIPFELGIRFYTDYLENNRYFKVAAPEDNLYRAQAQFRLCASIIRQEDKIQSVINGMIIK